MRNPLRPESVRSICRGERHDMRSVRWDIVRLADFVKTQGDRAYIRRVLHPWIIFSVAESEWPVPPSFNKVPVD